jgi:ABC-type nitrate/sulfonate/bicarbonate transport system ATPase subunit
MTLDVSGLWKGFAHRGTRQWVLRGLDLSVRPGELVSLIGHSGCGKSTLIKVLGGLVPPDSGSVTLDGEPVTAPGPDRAMVFQSYSLLPRLSLLDNVRTAVRSARPERRDEAGAIARRYLTAVGLWDARDKRPHQVSGGMQQRTAVARAFAVEPRVLLLDEPFGALDALTRARLQAQLIELWQSESDTEIVVMVTPRHRRGDPAVRSDRRAGQPARSVGGRRDPCRAAAAPRPGVRDRRSALPGDPDPPPAHAQRPGALSRIAPTSLTPPITGGNAHVTALRDDGGA